MKPLLLVFLTCIGTVFADTKTVPPVKIPLIIQSNLAKPTPAASPALVPTPQKINLNVVIRETTRDADIYGRPLITDVAILSNPSPKNTP